MTEFNGEIASDSIAARIGRTTNGWRVDSYAEQSDSLFATSIQQKKNDLWPFYFGNNGPLCIFRTRIWLMKSANWPFFFVVSDFIRFCQNEWIHCVSSNVYNVDRAKVYNRQIWGGSLNNSTIVIVFISMDSIHFDDHGHDSLSDRTALGIHFSRKILKKHSNWIEEN